MRYLIDQDDILAEFTQETLDRYNLERKTTWSVADIKTWHLEDTIGLDICEFIDQQAELHNFYEDLKPVPGALAGMRELVELGHDVLIVSAVPAHIPMSWHGKIRWMNKHLPWFNLRNFISCSRKYLIKGDVLFDDAAHNTEAFIEAGGIGILLDRPHNVRSPCDFRVKSWDEFMTLVRAGEILKKR